MFENIVTVERMLALALGFVVGCGAESGPSTLSDTKPEESRHSVERPAASKAESARPLNLLDRPMLALKYPRHFVNHVAFSPDGRILASYCFHNIRLTNLESGQVVAYKILGPWDGGPEDGVLNYHSPLGMILLGKKVGEEVKAELPGGTERFKIVEIDLSS